MNDWKAMQVRTSRINGVEVRSLMSIITVYANTLEEAVASIEVELKKNPSRQAYYDKWVADGRFVSRG